MLDYNFITKDENIKVKEVIQKHKLIFECEDMNLHYCPKCGSIDLRCKDTYHRNIKWISIEGKPTLMRINTHKYCCNDCGNYFNSLPKGLLKHQQTSEFIKREVFQRHCQGISKKDLSITFNASDSSVERWFKQGYEKKNRELKNATCPRILGIDEHYFSKKKRYATTFVNLQKRKVFDIVLGKAEHDLVPYLARLRGKDKVRVVVIDLSSTYRSIVQKYFPNALIVSDRFHVIKLVLDSFIKTCYKLDPNLKKQFKFGRLLRKRKDRLNDWERQKLQVFFDDNPVIKGLYNFTQELMILLNAKSSTYKNCKRILVPKLLKFIEMLKECGFEFMKKLGKTMENWQEEIARMFRFTKSNGITEGFHRKMKLIQRRAYGFRNFENYRLRVRILCG